MTAPRSPVGFMVWNPEHGTPTFIHQTLDSAVTEAERLMRRNPGQRFIVMAPVLTPADAGRAKVWGDGKAEGLAEAHRAIMDAEAKTDRALDKVGNLNSDLRKFTAIQKQHRAFQAVVADCLLWFDGFVAAYAGREPYERPNVPARETLRRLNGALQALEPIPSEYDLSDEIPF